MVDAQSQPETATSSGPRRIPLVDVRRQHDFLRRELRAAFDGIVDESAFIGGPRHAAFEASFAAFLGVDSCVGVANGSDALAIALMGLGVGPGDEVIVPAVSFFATSQAVRRVGAVVVFCDIDPATANLDVGKVERLISSRTKAILVVHLYGKPADMTAVLDIARRHGLFVVEDCAQAAGARWDGKRVGAIGAVGCFSFYPSKTLGALGDAGCVTTDDGELARRCRMLANHGGLAKYQHDIGGINSRLDTLQAAFLEIKLAYVDRWSEERRAIAQRYRELLDGSGLDLRVASHDDSVFHLFVVRTRSRAHVMAELRARGIGADVHYPTPLPFVPANADLGAAPGSYPHADAHCAEALSLPIFPFMTDEEIEYVAASLREIVGSLA
jgi:dTDP-4-amino-4,6-dideoxygalactose transaminase